jgi:hypothetical protein
MRSASLLQFGCVVLHPAIDRGMIDMQSPLEHHFLQVSIAERISEVPANTEQNTLWLEVTPFERGLRCHNHLLPIFWSSPRT